MSFQLRIKGVKELSEFIQEQNERRKNWRPRLENFFKGEMKLILASLVKELRVDTPVLTGTLQKRASFKFFKWNYFAFGYNENIPPTFNADASYWKKGKTAKYWQYATHRHKKNDFFIAEVWFKKILRAIDEAIDRQWEAHWKRKKRR